MSAEEPQTTTAVPEPVKATAETASQTAVSVAAAGPVESAAAEQAWAIFIKQSQQKEKGAVISLTQAVEICEYAMAQGKSMVPVVARYGTPTLWKHNGGSIEGATWTVTPNEAGVKSMSAFYTRGGRIRNIAYLASGTHLGGVSDWMTPEQHCVPGVRHPRFQ